MRKFKKKLGCVSEAARRSVSWKTLLSYSKSFEIIHRGVLVFHY